MDEHLDEKKHSNIVTEPVSSSFQLNADWPHRFVRNLYHSQAKISDANENLFAVLLINWAKFNLKNEHLKINIL